MLLYMAHLAQVSEERKIAAMLPEERVKYQQERAEYWRNREASRQNQLAESEHGPVSPQFICPHCQTKGRVRTKAIKKKAGISGGKATAAVITDGLSVLATGLSRKEDLTQAHCENCTSTWTF
jgi:hypothetical protein